MGQLPQLLAALLVLGLADAGVGGGTPSALGCAALALVPPALAAASAAAGRRGRFRTAELCVRLLGPAPLALHALALLAFGWLDLVEGWTGARPTLAGWMGPELLAGLLPWFAYELVALESALRWLGAAGMRGPARAFRLRALAASCLPLLGLVLLSWAVSLSRPLQVWIEEVSFAAIGATVLVALVFAGTLPFLLVAAWGGRPLDRRGWQHGLVRALIEEAGVRVRGLVVWPTGGRIANAAVVGFASWNRFVLFTDAMLARLGPRELAGVLAHELGHVRRGHVPAFAAWTGALFLALDLAQVRLAGDSLAAGGALLAGAALLWAVGFGMLSRRFELEADLESLELTRDPEALVGALEALHPAGRPRRSSWRHFGTERRVAFLRSAVADPARGRDFHRRQARWRRAGVAALVVALAGQAHAWADRYGVERVWVDLRLARYTDAAERAETLPELESELRGLAVRGRAAQESAPRGAGGSGPDRSPAEWGAHWEEEARRLLAAGDLDGAAEALELGLLAGRRALEPVLRGLRAAGSANVPLELPAGWEGAAAEARARRRAESP